MEQIQVQSPAAVPIRCWNCYTFTVLQAAATLLSNISGLLVPKTLQRVVPGIFLNISVTAVPVTAGTGKLVRFTAFTDSTKMF